MSHHAKSLKNKAKEKGKEKYRDNPSIAMLRKRMNRSDYMREMMDMGNE